MIIDGKNEALKITDKLKHFIKLYSSPNLAIIRVGNNTASEIYIRYKQQKAKELNINTKLIHLEETVSTKEIISIINELNLDEKVNGIIVQMPLPSHLDRNKIVCSILPQKDVDGFHPENFGKLSLQEDCLVSCTPMGCLHLIRTVIPDISGLDIVVIGRSIIVGRPMSLLLLNNDASVSILHSKSAEIKEYTKKADVIIACTGKAGLITKDMVNSESVIIDVGVTKLENGKIVGDCDFEAMKDYVKAITPSVGGVGPMTIAMLMYNTVKAYSIQHNLADFKEKCGNFL